MIICGAFVSVSLYLESVYKLLFLIVSFPKSLIGNPEAFEKTGFPLNRLRE